MTNLDWLRSLTAEELVPFLIQMEVEHTIDYDWDERPIDGPDLEYYVTTDSRKFENLKDAVDHENWWLHQPSEETP